MEFDAEIAKDYNFPKRAFLQATNRNIYHSKTNGLNEPLPDIYFKVPTGGGKTLLACHSIDLIHKTYLKKQTGLVLWIVPSTQIYRQTILALKNRLNIGIALYPIKATKITINKLKPISHLTVVIIQ